MCAARRRYATMDRQDCRSLPQTRSDSCVLAGRAVEEGTTVDIEKAVEELCDGKGYLLFEGYFSQEQVAEARELIYSLSAEEPARASHFYGDENETTQKRVWNLPEKGAIFRTMLSDPKTLAIMEPILGDDLMLSSYAANVLYQGAPAQEPHVDYPYWDLHARAHWPRTLNSSFFLAVETVVMLDEFTEENGATALVPGSQKQCRWPDADEFQARHIRVAAPAGSLFMFPALTWHAGQSNQTPKPRAALMGSYTCKSIKPIEDWSRCITAETIAQCDARTKALLGADYPYPAVMDALPARSSEGTLSKEQPRAAEYGAQG